MTAVKIFFFNASTVSSRRRLVPMQQTTPAWKMLTHLNSTGSTAIPEPIRTDGVARLVKWLVTAWVIWAGAFLGLAAVKDPLVPAVTLGVISGLWIFMLLAILNSAKFSGYLKEWFAQSQATRNPNVVNTIITLLVATVVIPFLYWRIWYPELNHRFITLERDTVDEAYFPSFTLFRRVDWSSQAKLQAGGVPPKCFLGWFDEDAPVCGIGAGANPPLPCQCRDSWADTVGNFTWQDVSYRSLTFQASKYMVSADPTLQMMAQTFFSYDTEKAQIDSSRILSPSLYIAVHDRDLSIEQALASGYTRMVLINANGMVAINLGLEYREVSGHTPAYDYQLTISTIPSTTLDCKSSATCFLTLIFQFPSFDRQALRQDVKLKWSDVASLAGSWLALFQLAGWILSGAAWYM